MTLHSTAIEVTGVKKSCGGHPVLTVQLYRLIGEILDVGMDEERLGAVADLMVVMAEESAQRGELDRQLDDMTDDAFVARVDSFAADSHPMIERRQQLMAERGWTGWSRIERAPESRR